ncbi:homoserine O-acetyltransferase MetX [Thermoflavimicrobium daqui]|uniref:Homoserine O-acetyltransferase n=1 Tax=Thermoflavimicrobium daqui TaxID=2137476 RepID=A0A364K2L3_9BACL|nr:homoserine O-acetyltransferase [Thermoflavimicrobium daqui]RAL22627.1 homoserine O-acetyltransferase [Thermoflavimicrobium daqui]
MRATAKKEAIRKIYPLPDLTLQSGKVLRNAVLAYETFGTLNPAKDNAILVCHALTGDSHAASSPGWLGWWDGVIGPGKALDTQRYFIICINVLGSCYGSTGPASINPQSGKPYGLEFPVVTIRDMVKAQFLLIKSLGIEQLYSVIGGSMGGMQVFEWAVMYPEIVQTYISIASCIRFSAMGIAWNHVMRQAIMNDPNWSQGNYDEEHFPKSGLNLARRLAMITYRSFDLYEERFSRQMDTSSQPYTLESKFQIENYLSYQGDKLTKRFDANSYLYLLKAMDLHDITRERGDDWSVLERITASGLLIGIDTDFLFPGKELLQTAELLRQIGKPVVYKEMQSIHGHDAFLIEWDFLNEWIGSFLSERGK